MLEAQKFEENPMQAMLDEQMHGSAISDLITDKDGKPLHDLTIAELRKEKKEVTPKNCIVLKDGFWSTEAFKDYKTIRN